MSYCKCHSASVKPIYKCTPKTLRMEGGPEPQPAHVTINATSSQNSNIEDILNDMVMKANVTK